MNLKRLANHLYEAGHLKRTVRSGQRGYLEPDFTDSIASHTYRVAIIAWHLGAMVDDIDPNKLAAMALFHDFDETRSGYIDWIGKRYLKVDFELINKEQLDGLDDRLHDLIKEYNDRKSTEAKLVKDADTLELILTLKELAFKGNKEAELWLVGKNESAREPYRKLKFLLTDTAK